MVAGQGRSLQPAAAGVYPRGVSSAIASHRRAIELDPEFAVAHYNRGLILRGQGEPDEAIACYRKAIELDPQCATFHANLGIALYGRTRTASSETTGLYGRLSPRVVGLFAFPGQSCANELRRGLVARALGPPFARDSFFQAARCRRESQDGRMPFRHVG
jgi:tetratricopeptide (TPR) repeat protein